MKAAGRDQPLAAVETNTAGGQGDKAPMLLCQSNALHLA